MKVATLAAMLLLPGCASKQLRPPAEGPGAAPRYLEVGSELSAATVHFPAGTYSLHAEDDDGFYYASPRGVVEHRFGGPGVHEGGMFVRRRNGRVRGYVIMPSGLTHLGEFPPREFEMHD